MSVFQSFDGFRKYLGHFNVLELFGHFLDLGGILVILRFQGVFISFLGLGGILVILEVLWVFWSF